MKDKFLLVITTTIAIILISNFSFKKFDKPSFSVNKAVQDTIKVDSLAILDSLAIEEGNFNYKLYKSKAHASYYAKRLHGKRTARGSRLVNKKYTAAHRKFAFGTKLRVTNLRNGKSVVVEVTDRGPFSRGREIDLSRRAFMQIAVNKGGGEMMVKIEIQQKK